MKYDQFENDSYNLYTIKCDKFKSCHLEIVFRSACTKENITYQSMLFDMLMENNKIYPTKKLLSRCLEDLYNLSLFASTSRVGNTLITSIVADFLDPKYMDEHSLEDIIKLIFTSIFNPNVDNDEFDENTFNVVKNRLKSEIEGIIEDPKQSSILNALKSIDENNPRGWNTSGSIDVLNAITPKKLYTYYKNVLEDSYVDIYIIGNLDMNNINKLIKKYAKWNSIKTQGLDLYLNELNNKKVLNNFENSNITQTQLVEIYSVNNLDDYELNYVLPIFNLLWGSGSLDSKLYKTIREENGLCYNIQTIYQKYDRIIILHTAIDNDAYNKAIKLIKNSFNDMTRGNITEEELNNTKKILINGLNLIYDNPSRLIDNYVFTNIANLPSIEERIDEYKKVTIDDLIKVSKKIKLVLNYKVGE